MRGRSDYNPVSSTDAEEDATTTEPNDIDNNTNSRRRRKKYNRIDTDDSRDDRTMEATPLTDPLSDPPQPSITLDENEDDGDEEGRRVTIVVLDSAQKKFPIRANLEWTIQKFKKVGSRIHKVPPPSQRLIYRGKMLEDSKKLKDAGIQDNVIVHLFPRPRVVITSSNSESTDTNSDSSGQNLNNEGAHVPQIVYDEEEQERRGQILVLGSHEIQEVQNNVKILSLLLLVVCSMRLLALFSIAMGVAQEPVNEDGMVPGEHNHTNPNGSNEYENRDWENTDYFDLVVSGMGFYVATLGMKATAEETATLRLATFYLIGTVIAGIGWNIWNIFMYTLFVQEETTPKDDDEIIPLTNEDFLTVAFFTVMLPMGVWFLCCSRAWQYRLLIEEAEQEAAERIRSQLTLIEETDNGSSSDLAETNISDDHQPAQV